MPEIKLIENSDRGITLNKQLAWTILAAIVGLTFWVGVTVTNLQASTDRLSKSSEGQDLRLMRLEDRIANSLSRIETELTWIKREIAK